MAKHTLSYANNVIRKTLGAIIDRDLTPSEKNSIWAYFNSRCCYCNKQLDRKNREGDMDHLVSGGPNHISNRVLSCKKCNGDEKRETNWNKFLRTKCRNENTYDRRRAKILRWKSKHVVPDGIKKYDLKVKEEIKRLTDGMTKAVKRLKKYKAKLGKI